MNNFNLQRERVILPSLFFFSLVVLLFSSFVSSSPFGYDVEVSPGSYTYNLLVYNGTIGNVTNPLSSDLDADTYQIIDSGNQVPGVDNSFSNGWFDKAWATVYSYVVGLKETTGFFTNYNTGYQNLSHINAITLNVSGQTNLGGNVTVAHKLTTKSLNVTSNIYSSGNLIVTGNMSVKRPYGMFSSTQTQTCAVQNTAYPMTFNWTDDAYQVIKASDNINFSVQQTGDYQIILSIMAQSNAISKRAYVWVQLTNSSGAFVDVPRSTTVYDFKAANAYAVIAVPFILDLETTDKFRVMYAGNDNGISFPYLTNTSFAPETPSVVMTMLKISEITD